MVASISVGVLATTLHPNEVMKRSLKAGCRTISRTVVLTFSTISAGVRPRAANPNQMNALRSGCPSSAVVGMAGNSGEREFDAIARAFNFPVRKKGPAVPALATESCISLVPNAFITGAIKPIAAGFRRPNFHTKGYLAFHDPGR